MATKKKSTKKKVQKRTSHWPWRTIVLYGESGIGKTTVSGTAPTPYFLDSNLGVLAIEGRPGFEHVRSAPVLSMGSLQKAYDRFSGTRRPHLIKRHQTVVFDHFDDIQGIVMDQLTARGVAKDSRRDEDEYQLRDYGIMGNRLRRIIRQWKSLPCHKILIFSVGMDKITGQLQPHIIGKLRQDIPYFADYIFYMKVGKKSRRYIYLDQTDRYLAKCRAWWIKERRIEVPDPDTDPKFFTHLFERLVAGPPKGTNKSAAKGKR